MTYAPLRARRLILGGALTCALALLASGSAHADALFNESFTHPTVSQSGFSIGSTVQPNSVFKGVCLTASTNTAQTPVPGCAGTETGIAAGGDSDGSGALRFTSNEQSQAGFLLSNQQLPLTAGVDITFDYYSYGGSGADGLSFFLVDGATTLTKPGAVGGSLGYDHDDTSPGVANGYVGVGLDEFGNYTNSSQSKGNGCAGDADFPSGTPVSTSKNHVGVRGPGNGLSGYCLLAKGPSPAPLDSPAPTTSRDAGGVQQQVEIRVDPPSAAAPQVTVILNGIQVLQTAEPANPPSTFKFGFAASTGGSTNVHEIRNVQINTINTLPKLTVTSTPSATPTAGTSFTSTLQGSVDPSAGSEGQPVTITQTLPAGETVGAVPSGTGWDCAATMVGSSTVSCTYTPGSPLAPGATLPPLSVPTAVAPGARGPLTATTTISSTDNANTPPQSSSTETVTPTAAADTKVTVAAPAGPAINTPATFTVTATNSGPSTATNTTVKVPVPAGTSFSSAPRGCALQGDSVVCAIGTLAPGAKATLPIVFTPTVFGAVTATATVSQTESDPTPANNTGSATATVPAPPAPQLPAPPPATPTSKTADLGVTVTGPATPPAAGVATPFTVDVTNHGGDPDTGVVVSIPVPSGARVSALSPGCEVVSQTVLCVAGSLPDGKHASFTVVVVPAAAGPLSVVATATGDLPDPAPSNNVASATTTVTAPTPARTVVDLGVRITTRGSAPSGTPVVLDARVSNHRAAPATGVVLVVPLPPGSRPVSIPKGCVLHGTVVICTVGKLKPHGSAHVRITVRPRGTGTQGVTATVRSTQTDAKPANNHATAKLRVTPGTSVRKPVHRHAPKPAKPRLALSSSFRHRSVLSGHKARLTLRVRTSNHTTAHHVTVCDAVPPGMTIVSVRGARVHGRRVCATFASVGAHPRRVQIELRARVVTRSTVRRDRATAVGRSSTGARARGRIVVVPSPSPKFTG